MDRTEPLVHDTKGTTLKDFFMETLTKEGGLKGMNGSVDHLRQISSFTGLHHRPRKRSIHPCRQDIYEGSQNFS